MQIDGPLWSLPDRWQTKGRIGRKNESNARGTARPRRAQWSACALPKLVQTRGIGLSSDCG